MTSTFTPGVPGKPDVSEATLLTVVSAVQFVNILDFMMVMPLGPDFAAGLGIEPSKLGLIGGGYTASAAAAGLLFSPLLDRFGRRQALVLAMAGLALATALGGAAFDLPSLLAARVLAGLFGGPATSIAMSIVADSVPPERRGRALGIVMGSFAVASVLGVPAGLELSTLWGWRAPFFAVGALGGVVTCIAATRLPALRAHLEHAAIGPRITTRELLSRPIVRWSLAATAIAMGGTFMLVPNLAAFLQFNRGYPREHLGTLYLVGGSAAFFWTRIAGTLTDKLGSTRVAVFGTTLFVGVTLLGVVSAVLPVSALFVGFMLSNSSRMIPMNTLTSRVPAPQERARFLSVQSAVQHLASALGAILSTWMLSASASGALIGMDHVAFASLALACVLPFLIAALQRRVLRAEAGARAMVVDV